MHPCKFPSGFGKLKKKNDFEVKVKTFVWNFELDNIKYKSVNDTDKSKYRITLVHKVTGEVLHFEKSFISFKPEINKLIPSEIGGLEGVSKTELLKEFGTSRDQRLLKEKEKQLINIEAKKAVHNAQVAAATFEKNDVQKGLKLENSYMDLDTNCSLNGVSPTKIITDEGEIYLSKIAPEEVLKSLAKDAASLVSKKGTELEEMVRKNLLHQSILTTIKKIPISDKRKIQLCLLLDYMITFYLLPIKNIRSRTPIEDCPQIVQQFFIKNYTMTVHGDAKRSTIQVPKDEKEKLLLMILALICYLNDYNFTISEIQADLKCSTDRLKKHFQLLNVKVSRAVKNVGEETASNDFVALAKTAFVLE